MSLESRRGYHGTNLVDILDRIVDKGLVVAGDVRISRANVELLPIRIRFAGVLDRQTEQIDLNWWRYDRSLIAQDDTKATIARLENRIVELERQLARSPSSPRFSVPPRPSRAQKR